MALNQVRTDESTLLLLRGRRRLPRSRRSRRGRAGSARALRARRVSSFGLAAAVLTLLSGCGYSQIQELDDLATSARSDIEVQLQRRAELVPNLIETVRAYGSVGEEVVARVADARAGLVRALRSGDLQAMEMGSIRLSGAIGQLMGAAGRRADLQLDAGFAVLRSQLERTEERIQSAGRSYNEAVRHHNEYIRGFPQLVTARLIGAEKLQALDLWGQVPLVTAASEGP